MDKLAMPDLHDSMALHRIREHAQIIRTLLESPGGEKSNLRLWRALYESHGEVLAATIANLVGQQINCLVQRRYGNGTSFTNQTSREGFTDPNITAEEMAVFLGLDDVEPYSFSWVEQKTGGKKVIAAYGGLPNGGIPPITRAQ